MESGGPKILRASIRDKRRSLGPVSDGIDFLLRFLSKKMKSRRGLSGSSPRLSEIQYQLGKGFTSLLVRSILYSVLKFL